MSRKGYGWKSAVLAVMMLFVLCGMTAFAGEGSGDNSLSSLGITTEGAVVSPEFYYSTIEYQVTVPAGTARLELSPTTSNSNAWIVDITGQDLTDGKTTVKITVSAENGSQYSYYLYVTEEESAGTVESETEEETEPETEAQTESETEESRYVKVDRNSLQEAENTIATLKAETISYRDRVSLLTKIMYGLIALSVILLFVVINLILKKKDLKEELAEYRELGYPAGDSFGTQGYAAAQRYEAAQSQGYSGAKDFGDGQGYYVEEEPQEPPKKKKESRKRKDDLSAAPKPSKTRGKAKEMPQYGETDDSGQKYRKQEESEAGRTGQRRAHSSEYSREEQLQRRRYRMQEQQSLYEDEQTGQQGYREEEPAGQESLREGQQRSRNYRGEEQPQAQSRSRRAGQSQPAEPQSRREEEPQMARPRSRREALSMPTEPLDQRPGRQAQNRDQSPRRRQPQPSFDTSSAEGTADDIEVTMIDL